jgi:hypothetical protein
MSLPVLQPADQIDVAPEMKIDGEDVEQ